MTILAEADGVGAGGIGAAAALEAGCPEASRSIPVSMALRQMKGNALQQVVAKRLHARRTETTAGANHKCLSQNGTSIRICVGRFM